MGEAGEEGLGLAGLNNFSRLQRLETAPSCLVLDPGVILRQGLSASTSKSSTKEIVGGYGFCVDLFAHESMLSGEWFIISRIGAVSSGLARPQMSEHHKIWKIKYTINRCGTAILVDRSRVGTYKRHDGGFCQAHNQLSFWVKESYGSLHSRE